LDILKENLIKNKTKSKNKLKLTLKINKVKYLLPKFYYKKLKIKHQPKSLVFGKLFTQVKKVQLQTENSILIVLKVEELSLINK